MVGAFWLGEEWTVGFMGGKYDMMVCEACVNWDSNVDMIREM